MELYDVVDLGGRRVLRHAADGPPFDTERALTDLIGDAMGEGATVIAIPAARLGAAFFQLRSGLAGSIAQKVVNYHMTLAIIGDIAAELAASNALRDWVRETNRGRDVWFLPSFDELATRLAALPPG